MLHTFFDKIWKCGYNYGSGCDDEGNSDLLRKQFSIEVQKHYDVLNAVENLLKVKGRYHTEQAFKQLQEAYK